MVWQTSLFKKAKKKQKKPLLKFESTQKEHILSHKKTTKNRNIMHVQNSMFESY